MLFVVTPKFCIRIVFSFSWELKWSQEKLKTMFMQNFADDKQRALWYVMVFSGVVNCGDRDMQISHSLSRIVVDGLRN